LDDELAKTIGLKSMEELKLKVEDGLARLEEKKFDGSVREEITDRLIEWNPFQPPKSLVEEEYHCMLENIKSSYNKKDFTEDEEKKLREEYYPMAEKRVRYALISARVQEKENIKVAEEDINKEKERIINEGQYKREEVEDFFRKNLEDLMEQVKSEKIYNYFLEKATIKRKYV
jgi:trigger factor